MKTRSNLERKIVRGLDSINLDIKKGDKIAIIGPNGSGKTTLLKLLAGIYTPTDGKIDVFGKVSSMIDLGFGFVDDATGYENIILSKVIRGESIKDKKSIMDLKGSPIRIFKEWYMEAEKKVSEPNAFALSTCYKNTPSSRMMLLKDFSSISWILLLLRHLEENLFLFFLIKIWIQIRPTKKIPTVRICEALIPWTSIYFSPSSNKKARNMPSYRL